MLLTSLLLLPSHVNGVYVVVVLPCMLLLATFIFIVGKALLSETFDETFTYKTRLELKILLNLYKKSEAGVLKKLNLASLAKLSWLRFGLASAGYCGLEVYDRPVYVNSQQTHS
jgi:hypothetical protein